MPTLAATEDGSLAAPPPVPPDASAAARPGLRQGALYAGLLALMLAARLPAYQVNENYAGDAVSRTELAQRWAQAPHWLGSFSDGAFQYGPLHLYVVGAALKLGVPADRAGPLTSLLFGTLTVLPLAALTRRLFGPAAAAWSGAALACWGMHMQMSTTGASEALSLFLVLSALALFDPARPGRLAASGLVLTLACAVRYDTWLLIPLLSGVTLLHGKDRRAAFGRAVAFGLCCLPFPAAWLYGNARDMGDPFFPMRYVEAYHRQWVLEGLRLYGERDYRLQNLGFWPGVAALTLGPPAAIAGFAGMGWAFRHRPGSRWLLWAAWAPAAYFTFRSAVLVDFQPLARFTMAQVALVLPFLQPGAALLLRRAPRRLARAAVALGAACSVGVTAWLAAYTWDATTYPALSLAPVSPVSRNPPELRRMLEFLHGQRLDPWASVLLDADPKRYWDMQLGFFLRHPAPRLVRRRWPSFWLRRPWFAPAYVVRFEGGLLESTPGVELQGPALLFDGRWYDEVPGAPAPMRLYRARR